MENKIVASLRLRIVRIGDRLSLEISSCGLNVSARQLDLVALDFLALANMEMRLGDRITMRPFLDGPPVAVTYGLESAHVAPVPL